MVTKWNAEVISLDNVEVQFFKWGRCKGRGIKGMVVVSL